MTYFAPLGIFAVLLIGLGWGLTGNPQKMPPMLIDKALPAFALGSIEGRGAGLASADIKDDVALVNVFASWCPVCIEEHPMLEKLSTSGAIKIYGIDWNDARRDAARWLARRGNPYAQVGFDENGRVGVDMGVTGVPETFLIDGAGRVRYRHTGALTEQVWAETFQPLIASLRSRK